MSDVIDWGKVGGVILAAPVGSLDFKGVSPAIKKVDCLSVEEPQSHCGLDSLSFDIEVKMSDRERHKLLGLFKTVRVPRKTKKAIKKQCPGITPSEIQKLLFDGWHFRRIKHRRK